MDFMLDVLTSCLLIISTVLFFFVFFFFFCVSAIVSKGAIVSGEISKCTHYFIIHLNYNVPFLNFDNCFTPRVLSDSS